MLTVSARIGCTSFPLKTRRQINLAIIAKSLKDKDMNTSSLLLFLLVLFAYETVGSGCGLKRFTLPVYHDNGDFLEKCYVRVYGCHGGCDNSYTHKVHKEGDFDDANINCKWNHKPCSVQTYSDQTGQLFSCRPLDRSQTSQFDSSNPWTVTIKNATQCYCDSALDGEGDGDCPIN